MQMNYNWIYKYTIAIIDMAGDDCMILLYKKKYRSNVAELYIFLFVENWIFYQIVKTTSRYHPSIVLQTKILEDIF